jgi:serine/threonine-protein kinase
MGDVYEARHLQLGRRVAIKFLRSALMQDATHQKRFEREARAAGALEHENVGAILDIGRDEQGTPFIVMEYLDGETLRVLIEQRAPLPVPRAVSIVLQIGAGLAAAHARGIVHRDLKPENLMVCRRADGRDWIKILDFGIARVIDDATQTEVTATGVVLGTAHYMSPEQARGEAPDARTDVHAVGAILYELLSGKKAHPGDTYNTVIYHVLGKEVAPLISHRAALPSDLCAVVHRALSPISRDRFASIQEFVRALEKFGDLSEAAEVMETRSSLQLARLPRHGRSISLALGILVALLVGAYFVLRVSDSQPVVSEPTKIETLPRVAAAQNAPIAPTSTAIPARSAEPTPAAPTPKAPATPAPNAQATPPLAPARRTSPKAPATRGNVAPNAGASEPAVPEGFVDNPYGK